jgi:hypothetical protein
VSVEVHNLNVRCSECGDDISREDSEQLIADAQRLLRWLDMAETI